MSFMQQKNTFVALAALATVIAGCATETGEEPQDQQDTQDTQAPAGQQDVKVEVDTSQSTKPKMDYWCSPGQSSNVTDCRSGTCVPAQITCDSCSWWDNWWNGGCWVNGS
jgi:hypothetical protein